MTYGFMSGPHGGTACNTEKIRKSCIASVSKTGGDNMKDSHWIVVTGDEYNGSGSVQVWETTGGLTYIRSVMNMQSRNTPRPYAFAVRMRKNDTVEKALVRECKAGRIFHSDVAS
jgi:hypothetical protein